MAPPSGFKGALRLYQKEGLSWLQFLREVELGGILADDMGLGKTVQTLAHILVEKQSGRADRPSLGDRAHQPDGQLATGGQAALRRTSRFSCCTAVLGNSRFDDIDDQ